MVRLARYSDAELTKKTLVTIANCCAFTANQVKTEYRLINA